MGNLRNGPAKITKTQRDTAILELRKSGMGFPKIAEEIGVSSVICRQAVSRAMRALLTVDAERLDEVMQLELERTNDMMTALWPKVLSGDERAILTALKVQERRAKYWGLDAADRLDVNVSGLIIETGPPRSYADEIKERLAEIHERLKGETDVKQVNGSAVVTNGRADKNGAP